MFDVNEPLGPANLIGLIFLGVSLIWTVRLVYSGRRGERDWLRRSLQLAGTVLAILGAAGLLVSIAGGMSIFLLVIGAGVLLMSVERFRASERRALLWMLATAAEKGIPLPVAVRVFADRRDDELGDRFARLAALLEGGVTLPWAIERSGNRLGSVARAAVDIGEQSGALGPILRKSLSRIEEMEFAQRRIFEKYLYLAIVTVATSTVLSYMLWRLMPQVGEMFVEFELEVPPLSKFVFAVGDLVADHPYVPVLFTLGLWSIVAMLSAIYVGAWPSELALFDRLSTTNDRAAVLRALGLAVRGGRPLAETVRVLSWRYPKRRIRMRLERASKKIDAGGDWRAALASTGMITSAESAMFAAAERVGNLGWALDEMADSAQRRLLVWMRAVLAIAFPATLLTCGAIVSLVMLSIFVPLFALVQGLS